MLMKMMTVMILMRKGTDDLIRKIDCIIMWMQQNCNCTAICHEFVLLTRPFHSSGHNYKRYLNVKGRISNL